MKVEQKVWRAGLGWEVVQVRQSTGTTANLVLAFGGRHQIADPKRFSELRETYPQASIIMCSTAGEISDGRVFDETIVATAIYFERTSLRFAQVHISDHSESRKAGRALIEELLANDLRHILVFSDGQCVNGSQLVKGLTDELPSGVQVTGGLAGDAARFECTLVGLNEPPTERGIVAIGLYGDAIRIGMGSRGGWDSFGQDRQITRSDNNILYELDGRSALDLYKEYLGDRAKDLPGAALLFPLSVKVGNLEPVVRTILSIDEGARSMTFAGDMPEGALARLMKANFDRLVDGANDAAGLCIDRLGQNDPELAILISCVGRKLVLDERVEEEVETVREVLGKSPTICGFYSYGEISPFTPEAKCELHNQTMTITTLREV